MSSWVDYFQFSPGWQERDGHLKSFEWANAIREEDCPVKGSVWLITGYGKTLNAYGVFEILKRRGIVNRMLVFVPGDEQRRQFADDAEDARTLMGCTSEAWVCEKRSAELRMVQRGLSAPRTETRADVFVACYQQLTDDHFAMMLEAPGTSWLVICDEYHHLYENGRWASRQDSLPGKVRFYMSATPLRSDGRKTHGAPITPISNIDYQQAYGERAVRLIVCHNEHYQVHCEDGAGNEIHFTTADLLKEKVDDEDTKDPLGRFQSFEIRRQLRYKRDYLDWMLLDPIQKLQEKQIHHPSINGHKQHQMIVFTMSCKHADHVCWTIREISRQLNGGSISCEWVGVGEGIEGNTKTQNENDRVIAAFRNGELDILVQVDKCGEGFSVKTASVLVFLNLIKSDPKLLQQIGRGLRRNGKIECFEDDVCDIFVSADSPVAKLVQTMEAQVRKTGDTQEDQPRQAGLFDIPDLTVVRSDHSHREVITPGEISILLNDADEQFAKQFNIPPEELLRYNAGKGRTTFQSPTNTARNSRERLSLIMDQVSKATSFLVGNIIRIIKERNIPFDGKRAGEIKRSVNAEWVRHSDGKKHEDMLEGDFRDKHLWLQAENKKIKESRGLPSWLSLDR